MLSYYLTEISAESLSSLSSFWFYKFHENFIKETFKIEGFCD